MKKNKFILNKKKSIVTWSTMLCMLISSVGCDSNVHQSKESEISDYPYGSSTTILEPSESIDISGSTTDLDSSQSVSTDTSVQSLQTETTEITSKTPTGFDDYLDTPAPKEKEIFIGTYEYNGKEVSKYIYNKSGDMTLFVFGFDNPKLTENIQELVGDNTVDAYSINCFQDYYKIKGSYPLPFNFSADIISESDKNKLKIDFMRYVFAANDARFLIDILSWQDFVNLSNKTSLFSDSFYDTLLSNSNYQKYCDLSDFRYFSDCRLFDDVTSDIDFIEDFALNSYSVYQNLVCGAGFSLNDMGDQVKIIKSDNDGTYKLRPTEGQYNYMVNTIEKVYGVRIDTLHNGPETREDLIASGVEVEKLDEIMEVLGLKKLESLEETGSPRTRG